MPEYAWMCLNKKDSEYALGGGVVNMPNFWIWHSSGYDRRYTICDRYTAFWISQNMSWQSSEYILGSKYARILNMAEFWICKSYAEF